MEQTWLLSSFSAFFAPPLFSAARPSAYLTRMDHHDPMSDDDITPGELALRIASGDAPALVDVREPAEWSIARLPGARLVPLDTLPQATGTLDRDAELVIYCHHGVRSAAAVAWLRARGFARARNLAGGIDRWSLEVDPGVRRY